MILEYCTKRRAVMLKSGRQSLEWPRADFGRSRPYSRFLLTLPLSKGGVRRAVAGFSKPWFTSEEDVKRSLAAILRVAQGSKSR